MVHHNKGIRIYSKNGYADCRPASGPADGFFSSVPNQINDWIHAGGHGVLHLECPLEADPMEILTRYFSLLEAAGGAVINPAGELMMIFRNGHWDLPKGMIDSGEAPPQTALREIREECGITGLQLRGALAETLHIYIDSNGIARIKKTWWFQVFAPKPEIPIPQLEEGIEEIRWISKEKLDQYLPLALPMIRDLTAKFFQV